MSEQEFRLPVSGVALGVLVDALGIRSVLEARHGISAGSLRSLLAGERVRRETTLEAVAAVVDVVWPADLSDELFGRSDLHAEWRDFLRESLQGMLDAWDAGRANLSTGYPGVARWDFAVLPWIRLVVIDASVRWAFFLLATGAALPSREWVVEFLNGQAFAATLQAQRTEARLTREELAERSGTDPDDWLDGARLPQFSKVAVLATTIARAHGSAAAPGLERRVWLKLLAARAASALYKRICTDFGDRGTAIARDLSAGCAQLMRFLRALGKQQAPPDSQGVFWLHVAQGVRGPWARVALETAAENTQLPHERNDLRGITGDWGELISRWYRDLSAPDEAIDRELAVHTSPSEPMPNSIQLKELLLRFPSVMFPHERDPAVDHAVGLAGQADDTANNETAYLDAQSNGDWQAGLRACRRLVELKPKSAKYHFWLGCVRCELGDFQGAVLECEIANQLADGWVLPAAEVAIIHLRAGRPDLALEVLRDVVARFLPRETSGRTAAHVLYHEAVALLRLGRTVEAVPVLRNARDLDPENADVAHYLAHALLLSGLRKEGREVAKAAAHLGRREVLEVLDRGDYDEPRSSSRKRPTS